jgi:hypothetical protein
MLMILAVSSLYGRRDSQSFVLLLLLLYYSKLQYEVKPYTLNLLR